MERARLSPNNRRSEVLVVGAGPAGLAAGLTLARYGIRVEVVDKRHGIPALSRALVISTRGMELMRRWGLEDAVRAVASDVIPRVWVTPNLACGEGAESALGHPSDEEATEISPCRPAWAPQDHHEPILLAHLRQMPTATVRFRCELTGLSESPAGVHAVLRDRETGATSQLDAQYVIGADGAHSDVRDQLGIGMEGPGHLADYERAEFAAPLTRIVGDRPYALYAITGPDAAGILARRGRGDQWGLSRERIGGQPSLTDLTETALAALIARAAGVESLPVRIERLSTFPFAAQIADRYREGRSFLVGDAAHRMTPRGGTGMNTAIQDSFDLGWKLAWVLRGWARPSLLGCYESERRPVGLHNVERSARADGARATTSEALAWDLNGRVSHHWTANPDRALSTLDLVGDGLTLLAGPGDPRWANAKALTHCPVPLTVHVLDAGTASALELTSSAALLLRPDGREAGRWSCYDQWFRSRRPGPLAAATLTAAA